MKTQSSLVCCLISFVCIFFISTCTLSDSGNGDKPGTDAPWYGSYGAEQLPFDDYIESSRYLSMRDGVKIAISVYLPKGLIKEDKVPTILQQTMYWRAYQFRWPFSIFFRHLSVIAPEWVWAVRQGYALVVVDVRGTGASFGEWLYPYSPEEVKDGSEVVDWIIKQPWSDGSVGVTGISYVGTTADFMLTNQHPAVKASAPLFSLFDTYNEIAFPGGIRFDYLLDNWGTWGKALGNNDTSILSMTDRMVVAGVKPVDDDPDAEMLAQAIKGHKNNFDSRNFEAGLLRDDVITIDEIIGTVDTRSVHTFAEEIQRSDVPIYSVSGWYDGAYPQSAVERYLRIRTPGSKLLLGPWPHQGKNNSSPYSPGNKSTFYLVRELVRFFDFHLKGIENGIGSEPPVHYFTIGKEKWESSDRWPPDGISTHVLYLDKHNKLNRSFPVSKTSRDTYEVDFKASTGTVSRWDSLINSVDRPDRPDRHVEYPNRDQEDQRLQVYNSEPLAGDIQVTGHPVVTLFVESTASDGAFFVYLEDVLPDGTVHYVTEGILRGSCRKTSEAPYPSLVPYHSCTRNDTLPFQKEKVARLDIGMQPVSYLFPKNHRIRIAIAGADREHFEMVPADGIVPVITFHHSSRYPSRVDLPVLENK